MIHNVVKSVNGFKHTHTCAQNDISWFSCYEKKERKFILLTSKGCKGIKIAFRGTMSAECDIDRILENHNRARSNAFSFVNLLYSFCVLIVHGCSNAIK